MDSTLTIIVILAIVAIAAAILVGLWMRNTRRSDELRDRFGPEYDRTVQQLGRSDAEPELASRVKRVEKLQIRPLSDADRDRYAKAWRATQAHFVDDPSASVSEADSLVQELMEARGYPVGSFEQRAADISVDHPDMVEHYRAARDIAVRNSEGQAGTEDLRAAVVQYRALFEDLLEPDQSTHDATPLRTAREAR